MGGGRRLDGGNGETLAACTAAACRSGGPRPVASILRERMRSGRCQHVCMRCDPPSSRCRAHFEEEVAGREQHYSSRPDDAARAPGQRRGCSSGRSATLHEACGACGAYRHSHRRSCVAFACRVPRVLSVLVRATECAHALTRHEHSGACRCLLHACSSRCQACTCTTYNEHVGTSTASAGHMLDGGAEQRQRRHGEDGRRRRKAPPCDTDFSGRRTGRKRICHESLQTDRQFWGL